MIIDLFRFPCSKLTNVYPALEFKGKCLIILNLVIVNTCQINDTHRDLEAWKLLSIGNKAWFNYSVF